MGQNRGIPLLPAPRVLSAAERLKQDARIYDAIAELYRRLDELSYVKTIYSEVNSTTIMETAAEVVLWPGCTLPAFEDGDSYRIRAGGVLSTSGECTFRLWFRLDSTTLIATPTVTVFPGMDSGVSNAPWWLEAVAVCRSSGVLMVNGNGFIAAAGLAAGLANTATVAIDTGVSHALDLCVQMGTESMSNNITVQNVVVEKVPAP